MSNESNPFTLELSRREALKLAVGVGTATVIPLVGSADAGGQAGAGSVSPFKFFTPAQHRTVEALTEVIIPADARSPGARAAKVADYIDLVLSDSPAGARHAWSEGLAAIDGAGVARFGQPFADLTAEQQMSIVAVAAASEQHPTTTLERFFVDAKNRTIHAYYTSAIGIHQELQYKGNEFLADFRGCDHPEHRG